MFTVKKLFFAAS